jgi:hypothetical protein
LIHPIFFRQLGDGLYGLLVGRTGRGVTGFKIYMMQKQNTYAGGVLYQQQFQPMNKVQRKFLSSTFKTFLSYSSGLSIH